MRFATFIMLALLGVVHAELWFGKGGVPRKLELEDKLRLQNTANAAAKARNEQLSAELIDLQEGLEMVEEKARYELGMIKPNEILVQITAKR